MKLFMQYSNNISSLYCTCFKCWNVGHKEPGQVQGWTMDQLGDHFGLVSVSPRHHEAVKGWMVHGELGGCQHQVHSV